MPNVFISHSSKDKAFVKRLAVDLLNEGFPVWFDAWEVELGDVLIEKIRRGLQDASLVLLVLSRESLASPWVEHETDVALEIEARQGGTVLIPISIDDAEAPSRLRAKLCADFRNPATYGVALDRLCEFLRRKGAHRLESSMETALTPLVLHRDVYLDGQLVKRRMEQLVAIYPTLSLEPSQLVFLGDEKYQELRSRMIDRMAAIDSDPFFSPEFLSRFSADYRSLLDTERRFVSNLAALLPAAAKQGRLDLGEISHWYVRERVSHLLHFFWMVQRPGEGALERDPQWRSWFTENSEAEFYGVTGLKRVAVMSKPGAHKTSRACSHFSIPEDHPLARFLWGQLPAFIHEPLAAWGDEDKLFSRYIIPQAFAWSPVEEVELFLDSDSLMAGIA